MKNSFIVNSLTRLCEVSFHPRQLVFYIKKIIALFDTGGFVDLIGRLKGDPINGDYDDWLYKYGGITQHDLDGIVDQLPNLPYCPLVSVIMPVYNTPERFLCAAIESVRSQIYTNWELCIADDASTDSHIRTVLDRYCHLDSRIKVVYRSENGHISQASNSALSLAQGEFIALLDHDDLLTSDALLQVALELAAYPSADFIYSDQDKIDDLERKSDPYFKPGINLELLRCQNYVCHFSVYRSELIKRLGGFRRGYEGAQDWDLALRVIDSVDSAKVRHIPHILYHWRVTSASTANFLSAKPYVFKAQVKSVADHFKRLGCHKVDVGFDYGTSCLKYNLPVPDPRPLVSLVVLGCEDLKQLINCVLNIIQRSTYKEVELVIVNNKKLSDRAKADLEAVLTGSTSQVLTTEKALSISQLLNLGANSARGSYLGFISSHLRIDTSSWLEELLSLACRPDVGAVGGRLLTKDRRICHFGYIVGAGGIGHNGQGLSRCSRRSYYRTALPQDISALSFACMLIRKELFCELKGFDDQQFTDLFFDIDFCLRVRAAGYRNVVTPYANLYLISDIGDASIGGGEYFAQEAQATKILQQKWGRELNEDPYYSPNLSLNPPDYRFAFPPRTKKSWRKTVSY